TVFQPEAELMSAVAIGIPAERIHPPNSPDRASPSTAASAELEVEAAYLLSRVKADLGEQVGLERTGEGRLQIVGIVGTETRKDEILQSLGSLVHNPAVEIDIATEAEARRLVAQRATAGRVIVREVVVSSNEMPAHQHLRRYFAATEGENSSTESIDRNIREFAAQALKRASKALGHASALRRLVNQLPQDKVRTLTLDARSKWELMISEHARACHLEVKALREALEPIFFYDTGIEKENRKSESIDNASLAQVVEDLLALCRANDVITGAAFTISNKATRTYEFSTPQFWQSLRKAEALAKIIEMNEQYSFGKNSRQTQP
ncbi:MAG TPA: hypothetical protein VKD91_06050, partial [Pyrinomonadaceae bacterium]|nr:hypothetical protein [Pyrinomonadaceae bacterium]